MYSRRSEEGSRTPMQENRDVFDDEFAVDDFDMVADGFRPGMGDDERHSQDPPIRTASAHYTDIPDLITTPVAPTRNSISKTRSHENPFASPDDEPLLEFERTPSIHSQSTASYAPGLARRSTSSASSQMFAGTQSPRFGTGGPSHPYAMYPQTTVARSPSIATTSTIQPHRTSTIQQAPQHPYGMYPQGVSEDDIEDEDDTPTASQAVGFPGLGQTYQRVRGPDGEEQDIVGMDGHAEQLPPYTRYPEDGPKMPILAVPGELHSRGPVAGSDPGMPLMHQHLPPPIPTPMPPQSMTDQSSLSRHSLTDRGIDSHASMPLMERAASVSTESTTKSWKEKTWKEKRQTKVCGLPVLWLFMAACVAGFVGAVAGGIMGGYASGSKHGRDKADAASSSSSSSSLAEASMIAAPTVSPPSGTYALSLSEPTNVQNGCLTNGALNGAWDCDLVGSPALAISVGVPAAPRPTEGAFFFYASSDPGFQYGAQYKFMDTEFTTYQAVQESGEEDKGPAFYFGQTYDKIVLLPESTFPVPSGVPKKRDFQSDFELPPGWNTNRQVVNHGDKPWMCVWNDTLIEGWIYVEQNITSSFPITTSSSLSSTPTANSTPSDNSATTYTSASTSNVSTGPRAQVTAALATSASASHTASTMTVTTVSTQTPWNGRGPPNKFDDDGHYDVSSETAHKLRRRQLQRRQSTSSSGSSTAATDDDGNNDNGNLLTPEQEEALDTYHGLPPYPYLIKIEERRVPEVDGNVPYCQQFQLLNSGELVPFTNNAYPDGIKFDLAEQPPAYSAYDENASLSATSRSRKRQEPQNACHCEWWAE